jgi:flavin reductase (DIM6/NTAB) family NADH-FMN oxidoreductase RutF
MEWIKENFYRLLAPRLVALITTKNREGILNAAPFSFIFPLSSDPPLLGFATASAHHTYKNLKDIPEFVVNICSSEQLEAVRVCALPFPEQVDELQEAHLSKEKARSVDGVRIKECVAWIECRKKEEKVVGDHVLIVADVLHCEVKDEHFNKREGLMKPEGLLLHLGARFFCSCGKPFHW